MKRKFENIMSSLKTTIASYDFFVDFEKVYKNVNDISKLLDLLSKSLDKNDIDNSFIKLIHEHPEVLKAIPILLAIRIDEKKEKDGLFVLDGKVKKFYFDSLKNTDQEYLDFFNKTGLKDLLTQGKINNLKDYLTGVEVGLDTHARKNRSGNLMEEKVSQYLKENLGEGNFLIQATKEKIFNKYGLPVIKELDWKDKGKSADKKFDFAFKYSDCVYLVEANFFGNQGSKLNEVARSYEKLADEINDKDKIKFVWFTDGKGWFGAKNNLEESYEHQEYLFTIDDMQHHSLEELLDEYLAKKN